MAQISVILPCYNVEKYIDRCLTSITRQTIGIDALEIICIDDASTDNTWNRLQEWHARFPENIIALHSDVNCKQGTARNIGLEYSTSPWISFIDSDDWVELDYFEKLYQGALETDCEVITCQNKRDSSDSLTFFNERSTGKPNHMLLIDDEDKRKSFIHLALINYSSWGKLIKKSFLIEYNILFPEMIAYEDVPWGIIMHLYVKKAYVIEEYLYHYYINYSSTVLQMNAEYHIDLLTGQLQLWNELKVRNMLEPYYEELEYEFLFSCYLSVLKMIALRYETPPYSLYLLLKTCTLERIPDYRQNKYVQSAEHSPALTAMLESLMLPMDRNEFLQFAEQIKALGI